MRKWMLYISSFVIVISLFLGFLLQLLYRKSIFENNIEEYGKQLIVKTSSSIKKELDQEFSFAFNKATQALNFIKKEDIQLNSMFDDIIKESRFIKAISLKRKSGGSSNRQYCVENFTETSQTGIYELCKVLQNVPVYFYIDFNLLKKRINNIYKLYQDKFYYAPIQIIFYQKHVLYLNLNKDALIEHHSFIQEAQKLIKINKRFIMKLDGSSVFTIPIELNSLNIKDFFVFLGIAPYQLPLSPSMWFAIISVLLLCLIFLLSLLHWIRVYFGNSIPTYPMESDVELTTKSKKDYPELKNFISLVTEQEKKYELHQKQSQLEEATSFDRYYKLMNQYSLIDHTIICNNKGTSINATILKKDGKETHFEIDINKFYFPTILGKNQQSFYIYKGAGDSSPVKAFFMGSGINTDYIDGFILVALKKNWSEFIVHTISKEVEHSIFIDIYETTKKEFLAD